MSLRLVRYEDREVIWTQKFDVKKEVFTKQPVGSAPQQDLIMAMVTGGGGAAQVFSRFADFDWESIKLAGGAGLRLALDRVQRVNLRVDFAFCGFGCGDDLLNFYVTVREAF